jgi:hypothetical protein
MAEPPAPLLLALFEPDIAQNAGAMMRTCACLGVHAAIIEPAGFRINDSRFRRAGMDYLDALTIKTHDSWADFADWRIQSAPPRALDHQGPNLSVGFRLSRRGYHSRGARVGRGSRSRERVGRQPAHHPHSASAAFAERGDRRDDSHD